MPTEREQLQRARDLIMQKQFDRARMILLDIPHNTTAQQWLAKLEKIAPTGTGAAQQSTPPPAPHTAPRVEASSPIQPLDSAPPPHPMTEPPRPAGTVNIAINITTIRYAVAATVAITAALMIASFFFAPWLDLTQISFFGFDLGAMSGGFDVDEGPLKVTAMELWTGRNNGENFVLDVENPEGGFADVRLLDRLLILIPVGAIVLGWFAWMYVASDMNTLMTVGSMTVIAFLLLAAPYAWESMSNQQIEDDFRASMDMEGSNELDLDFGAMFGGMFNPWKDAYSTGEQKILGGLALLACLAGFGAEVLTETSTGPRR
jgi:hypothetical protein